jgi:hypothetical protein
MNNEEKRENYELAQKLLAEQNFTAALIAGVVATILAAAFYGITLAKWSFSYGFGAAGLGIVIGFAMQYPGRGIETKFAVAASIYTIAGCILGNAFAAAVNLGRANSLAEVLGNIEFSGLAGRLISTLSFIDLVFWFVAVWFAVFLVKRPLSRAERLAIGLYEMKG